MRCEAEGNVFGVPCSVFNEGDWTCSVGEAKVGRVVLNPPELGTLVWGLMR
jgi:hypothetical protein